MNANSKRLGIYLGIMVFLAAVAAGIRTVACLNSLDYEYGYFIDKTLIGIADVILWCGVVFMITYAFGAARVTLKPSFSGGVTYVPAGIVATATVFLAWHQLSAMSSRGALEPSLLLSGADNVLSLLTVVTAILSVIHFLLTAYITESKTELRSIFAIFSVAFFALYATYLYFTTNMPINAPNKLIDQMAYLFSALFFLYEARISLGREKWGGYCVFGLMAAMLTAYSSIPSLITYLAKGELISAGIEETLLTLSLFLFIVCRLALTITLPETGTSTAVAQLIRYAERRQDESDSAAAKYNELYAVQMTIDDLVADPSALLNEIPEMLDDTDDDAPLSEAENLEEFDLPSTVFEEGTLLPDSESDQISLSYDIFENTITESKSDDTESTEDGETESNEEDIGN